MSGKSTEDMGVETLLEKRKAAFSNSNMVRMREALRYLSGPKLSLFVSIPFYLHTNCPGLPGFIKTGPLAQGIVNFQSSGFYRVGLKQDQLARAMAEPQTNSPPCILGLYHIGSLGTFTQSASSDFDYWIIIDKTAFSPQRHKNFQQKLDDIVRHARESCGQKVSFFVMDQAEIRQDCYAGLKEKETLTAPKLFLKEEFYRTFLHIAGKVPLWTLLSAGDTGKAFLTAIQTQGGSTAAAAVHRDFLDLGGMGLPGKPDILNGILWHIVKSRADPVKALIKATMIFAHRYGNEKDTGLLCEAVKQAYPEAGIDDYRVDPYKILFDRIIDYHEDREKQSLSLIKNAVFLRLCSFPNVRAPEEGSPKKQLLDRYTRQWNLKPSQIKKILSYQHWSENEKQLLENTFMKRLSQMLSLISKDVALDGLNLDHTEQRNMTILLNKARERVNHAKQKIRPCSTFLRSRPFQFFLFQHKTHRGWELSAYRPDQGTPEQLHRSDTLLGLLGWIMENQIYHRDTGHLKLDTDRCLFESADTPVNPDTAYLRFQPAKPLSDDAFEHPAQWKKLMILLVFSRSCTGPVRTEFLALNSWGELYTSYLDLDTALPVHDRYRQITQTINQYRQYRAQNRAQNQEDRIRPYFFQLSGHRDPEAVHQIMQYLDGQFTSRPVETGRPKRPMLDSL